MRRFLPLAVLLVALSLYSSTQMQAAAAQTAEEATWIVQERAEARGVDAAPLVRLARCESTLNSQAVGDQGHSHGLVQLSDRATGLLGHFHGLGYRSAYNAWEAADYLARVASGEFRGLGITLAHWSCAGVR